MVQIFVSTFLIFLFVPIIIGWIKLKADKSNSSNSCCLKYPRILMVIAIIGSVSSCGTGVVSLILEADKSSTALVVFTHVVICVMTFIGCWLFLKTLNWQLSLTDEVMIYRNLFGIVRKIRYEDILRITIHYDQNKNVIGYQIYTEHCKIKVEYLLVNFNCFYKNIKKKLKKAENHIRF